MRHVTATLLKMPSMLGFAMLVTAAVYARFLLYGHISWDDPEMVFSNEAVRNFDLGALFSNRFVGNYIPLTMTVHALVYAVFGTADWGHHLVNAAVHLANGVLVFHLTRKLFTSPNVPLVAAVIFLVHPLQLESVGWISELKTPLYGMFFLLALIWYTKSAIVPSPRHYVISLLFFVCSCLCKPSAVIFPIVAMAIDVALDRRFSAITLINKVPFLLIAVLFGIINLRTQAADQFINFSHDYPPLIKTGLAGYAIIRYLLLFLFPINLSVIYPYPSISPLTMLTGFGALVVLACIGFVLFKRKRFKVLSAVLFFLFNLLLVLQFVPFGEALYADRYMYLAIIGISWLIGIGIENTGANKFVVGLLMVVFACLSVLRTSAWKSAISLYEDILKKYPSNFVALNSAGVESMRLNNDEKAIEYLNRAVTTAPGNYKGFYNRGLYCLKMNEPQQAIQNFNRALNLFDYHKALVGRAAAYYMMGDIPKAMADAEHAIKKNPDNPRAHFILGNCYNDLNKLDAALNEYNNCLKKDGTMPDVYFKRAIVFGKKQDFKSSLDDLELCTSLEPKHYEAFYWKGVAKINLKLDPCDDLAVSARNNFEPAIVAFNRYCR